MDTGIFAANGRPRIIQQLLPSVGPVLLVAIGYVDPGKWAAVIDGGARFGSDLVLLMIVFSFATILCQYLSACIAVVTGRNLSQICSKEYDKATCIVFGVLTEISMIALDLTMILGTAHGLNLIFGLDLFTCVFLTALDSAFFPVFSALLDNGKARFPGMLIAGFLLLFYVLGVLFSQLEISISATGTLTKLSGESSFALMSLLGANIMPHSFYLHSLIVQQVVGPLNVSKAFLCHDHFFAILCTFSGIVMVNCVLMNAAANVFYSAGIVLVTFQDALSLIDQAFRSSIVPFAFLLLLFLSRQITGVTWNLGRQAIFRDLFGMNISFWLHHVTIKAIAIIPSLYCVWSSGAEGIYQLLIFSQIVVALMLPSSVIPLFRIASSRSVMGENKVSQFVEFLALLMFVGMLGLKIVFLVEMMFGNSDWVVNMRWNLRSSISVPYIFLLTTASCLLCLTFWLATTPLKSAASRLDAQVWKWDINDAVPDSSAQREIGEFSETGYYGEVSVQKQEPAGTSLKIRPNTKESCTTIDTVGVSTLCDELSVTESVDPIDREVEATDLTEKTTRVDGDLATGKDDVGDIWQPEASSKGGKGEECGSGAGSLSRLAGLGRAARRQLATVLDEFWGQLFDFHGQTTQEAKAKNLDLVLGVVSKSDQKPAVLLKVNPSSSFSTRSQFLNSYVQNSNCKSLDDSERRYSSLRLQPSSDRDSYQPATVHGYPIPSYLNRIPKDRNNDYLDTQIETLTPKSPSLGISSYIDPPGFTSVRKLPGFSNTTASRNISAQSDRPYNDRWSIGSTENVSNAVNTKKFHSLPDISGLSLPFTAQYNCSSETGSLWSRQPFEQFGLSDKTHTITSVGIGTKQSLATAEAKLLQSFRQCIIKLLKLEGSDWLFRQNDGADEDLIDRVAARERFFYEAETREMSGLVQTDYFNLLVSSVPTCGEGCIWRVDLIISFGVWCIHRVLELSLMESRPELWGKYTYVLNRLQGIIDLAFSKPLRTLKIPCLCLEIPLAHQQRSSPPVVSNGGLPPPSKQGKGKITTAAMIVEMVKDVEIAISCRKGRSGTAAGDVAFPKGKENLASVLKRYKRRLASKPAISGHEGRSGSPKVPTSAHYGAELLSKLVL